MHSTRLLTPLRWASLIAPLTVVGYPLTERCATSLVTEDLERDLRYLRQLLSGEIPNYSIQKRYLRKGGYIVWISLSVWLVRDEHGTPQYCIGTIQEINHLKQLEQDLKRDARILDSAHDAIIVIDHFGFIQSWNQGADRLFGWSKQEALGNRVYTLLQTQLPIDLDRIRDAVQHSGEWRGELVHTNKSGLRIPVNSRWHAWCSETGEWLGTCEISRENY
jgi:PAS domain S-box-containing protein